MKTILFSLLICISCMAYSQTEKISTDSLYIVTYTTGTAWDTAKSPNEQPYFKEHSSNLSNLRKAGTIKFGARYAEKGIIIISASSFAAAKEIIFNDPAVKNNLFSADLQKLSPFYFGCIEKPK